MITQRELDRYLSDHTAARIISGRAELKKADLIRRLDAGEVIEGGPLSAEVTATESRRFSAESLALLIGVERAMELKERLPATVSRGIAITSSIFPPPPAG